MAGKKITELTHANAVTDNDLFIVETANGTCSIPYSEIKKMFQNMLEVNAGETQSFPFVDCAASHNGIFRGKDLTNIYTIDEICERISNGTFEDLYIGDYFDITISTEYTANEVVRCVLAGFDTMPFFSRSINNITDNTSMNINIKHHASIVTKNAFTKKHRIFKNTGYSAEGGFKSSDMPSILDTYATALKTKLNNHIVPHEKVVSNNIAITNGKGEIIGITICGCEISLLHERQVFGSVINSSPMENNNGCNLLPLFALNPSAVTCKCGGTGDVIDSNYSDNYWLFNFSKNIKRINENENLAVCYVTGLGYTDSMLANYSEGVRPYFLIG